MLFLLLLLCADSFETSLRSGLVALNENNLPVAQSQLEAASKLQPSDPRVWIGLAQTYWKLQKPDEANSAALHAQGLTKDPVLLRTLAYYYAETGNSAKTKEVVQAAVQHEGLEESYYFTLADVCLKQQNFAAALTVLQAGLKAYNRSAQLELAAGVAYYGLRRFPESIDAFLRTIQLDPAAEQPYTFLGKMLDQAEDRLPRIKEAFAVLEKNNPDSFLSCYLLAKAIVLEEPGRSETLFRKSIQLNDGFWESHFELGVLLDRQGRFEEAGRQIQRAIELNPKDPAPHYRLARIYDRLGRTAEAKSERETHARLAAAATSTR